MVSASIHNFRTSVKSGAEKPWVRAFPIGGAVGYGQGGSHHHGDTLTTFRIVKPATLTPFLQIKALPKARRDQLNELTLAKLTHVPPALIWKVRMSIWKAFNRHFAIPQYRLLPENRMAEAISFLSEMEVGPRGTVARKSAHLPLPLDEARQAISALTACIEQARSGLAALPESQRQETI